MKIRKVIKNVFMVLMILGIGSFFREPSPDPLVNQIVYGITGFSALIFTLIEIKEWTDKKKNENSKKISKENQILAEVDDEQL